MNFDLSSVAAIAEKFGVGGAVFLIFAIGVAWNLPKVLSELKGCLDLILKYRLEIKKLKQDTIADKSRTMKQIEAAQKRKER